LTDISLAFSFPERFPGSIGFESRRERPQPLVNLTPKVAQILSNVAPDGLDHFDGARMRRGLVDAKPISQAGQIQAA